MKKTVRILFVLVGLAGAILLSGFAAGNSEGAIVIKDFGCGFFDGDGNPVFTDATISVLTDGGVTMLSCKASGVANSTGKAVHWNYGNTGAWCGTQGGGTDVWFETISASGQAMLKCFVKL